MNDHHHNRQALSVVPFIGDCPAPAPVHAARLLQDEPPPAYAPRALNGRARHADLPAPTPPRLRIVDNGAGLPRETPAPQPPARIRAMLRAHKVRARLFPDVAVVDPNWDMLLDLLLARLENRQIYLTSLCLVSGLPITNAKRRVEQLIAADLMRRTDDPTDGRRVLISLTDSAVERLSAYLDRIDA